VISKIDEKEVLEEEKLNIIYKENDFENIKNYNFYKNKIKSDPNGDYIDNIHLNWCIFIF
jgi:hypothetical protein